VGKKDKSAFTYLQNYGQPVTMCHYAWYIHGGRENILVDAGSSIEYAAALGNSYQQVQTLDAGLNQLGLSCGDIDLVVVTHLHYDHIGEASKLYKARFLVQKDELEFGRNPHPIFASGYCTPFFDNIKFEIIDGDMIISDTISVIKTPGHTPGGQSVIIQTAKGVAVISGLCALRDNFYPINTKLSVVAPTIHTNIMIAYENMLKLKAMKAILIAPHDAEYMHKKSIP
jgi:glyoxylase-like metal-dependent hydrolase (beta-lactamase superfamily II)